MSLAALSEDFGVQVFIFCILNPTMYFSKQIWTGFLALVKIWRLRCERLGSGFCRAVAQFLRNIRLVRNKGARFSSFSPIVTLNHVVFISMFVDEG